MDNVKKVVLAYSGGLDTSVILKWLQDTYRCEVVTFTADLGQGEELEPARQKALALGIKPENIFIDEFFRRIFQKRRADKSDGRCKKPRTSFAPDGAAVRWAGPLITNTPVCPFADGKEPRAPTGLCSLLSRWQRHASIISNNLHQCAAKKDGGH